MSAQASLAPIPEIPQVTDAYRKAHKSYVLMSGLLAAWALIGITLNTKDKWGIELQSPVAVPVILALSVFYSGYRLIVEWHQCAPERRNDSWARLDNWMAHGIGVTAVAVAGVQSLSRIRFIDLLNQYSRTPGADVVFATIILGLFAGFTIVEGLRQDSKVKRLLAMALISMLLFVLTPYAVHSHQFGQLMIGTIIGLGLSGLFLMVAVRGHKNIQRGA
jgi:hypothetical protein